MMTPHFTIPVATLKSLLPGFGKVISRRSSLPALGCLHFRADAQGTVHLTATDLEQSVTAQVHETTSTQPWGFLVPLPLLSKVLKDSAPHSHLTFQEEQEETRLLYSIGSATLTERVRAPEPAAFPLPPTLAFGSPVPVEENFKAALQDALACTSSDASRYILQHAYIDVSDPKAHYVVGTDGRHLFSANSFQLGFPESLILPHRKFLLWEGFRQDGPWTLALAPAPGKEETLGWIKVQSLHWTFWTRMVEGAYPHWRTVLPDSSQRQAVIRFSAEAARMVCLAAPKLPGQGTTDSPVQLQTTDTGVLVLRARHQDQEASLPITGVEHTGAPVVVRLNRDYLVRALQFGLTELDFYDPLSVLVFHQEGRRMLVMPLREEADSPSPTPTETASPNPVPAAVSPATPTPTPEQSLPTTTTTTTATTPTQTETENENEEASHPDMKTINRLEPNHPTTTSPARSSEAPAPVSAFEQVREQLERIKENLKGVVTDLNDTLKLLSQAQREKRATEKEIEGIRDTLRSLQQVKI